jgi:hypothetical protein
MILWCSILLIFAATILAIFGHVRIIGATDLRVVCMIATIIITGRERRRCFDGGGCCAAAESRLLVLQKLLFQNLQSSG